MIDNTKHLVRIEKYEGYENLFCIDESIQEINPTGTFKDRQPKALEILIQEQFPNTSITIGAMSTGNTAFSLIHFIEEYNRKRGRSDLIPIIYVPNDLENRRNFGPDVNNLVIPAREYLSILERKAIQNGGRIVYLDFGRPGEKSDYLSTLKLARVAHNKGLIRPEGVFINITEGLENTAFLTLEQITTISEEEYEDLPKLGIKAYQPIIIEGLEELKKRFNLTPDYVICQFGAGILFNEVKDYLETRNLQTQVIPLAVGDPMSCADKIYASYWTISPNSLRDMGQTESRHDGSIVYGVEDWEIKKSLTELKHLNAEASGIAGFSILHRLEKTIPELDKKKHVILTINTGNGLPNFRRSNEY